MSVKMFGSSGDAAVEVGSAEISAAAIVSEMLGLEESDHYGEGTAGRSSSSERTPQSDTSALCTASPAKSQHAESVDREFGLSSPTVLTTLQSIINGTSLRGLQETDAAVSASIHRTKNAKKSRFVEPGTSPVSDPSTAGRPFVSASSEDFDDEPGRPVVSKAAVIGYMDEAELGHFLIQHNLSAEQYSEGVTFSIGEGGREFLRAALLHYTDGRSLQGASVLQLLRHAYSFGLWPLVQRMRAERSTGKLTGLHLAFSNYKAAQGRRRRRSSITTMHAIRDADGRILSIIYDPSKSLPIGRRGRSKLKLLITKRIEEDSEKATALLLEHGLHGVRFRDATVAELLAVAWVLGLWRSVEEIVWANEEDKRKEKHEAATGDENNQAGNEVLAGARKRGKRQRSCGDGTSNGAAEGTTSGCKESSDHQGALSVQTTQADESDCSVPVLGSLESSCEAVSDASARPPVAQAAATSPESSRKDAGGSETAHNQRLIPAAPSMQNDTQMNLSENRCRPLERIGQLVASTNPGAPNAKAVAAELVKELLVLVKEKLLPDPPAGILDQLQLAAARLGVQATLTHPAVSCATADHSVGTTEQRSYV